MHCQSSSLPDTQLRLVCKVIRVPEWLAFIKSCLLDPLLLPLLKCKPRAFLLELCVKLANEVLQCRIEPGKLVELELESSAEKVFTHKGK